MTSVLWNPRLRLIFSDVDDTVAELYRPATSDIVARLAQLLDQGIRIVFITGQSAANVEQRVVMRIAASLRHRLVTGRAA